MPHHRQSEEPAGVHGCSLFPGTSASTSGAQITTYEWRGVFNTTGRIIAADMLNTGCGFGSGTFQGKLELTVRDALGRMNTTSREVTFRKDSGC